MLEDVYPLSPLQEGLYYHWLSDSKSPAYFMQMSYKVKGELNIGALERSYQLLVSRHAILRTFFTPDFGDTILQVVKKGADAVGFNYKNVADDIDFLIDEFKETDRLAGFDLHTGSQMRLTILRLGENLYEFIWSFHHILMDGWCVTILIKEFFKLYHAILHGTEAAFNKVYPYSTYIQWLSKVDKERTLQFWGNYLSGYDTVSGIPRLGLKESRGLNNKKHIFYLEGESWQSLKNFCMQSGITESTFIHTAWGILLGKYNTTSDVVFGSVVSGRPPDLPGVEEMIGLFINTIPVRVTIKEGMKVQELLKQVQQASIDSSEHHYVQLAEIKSKTALGRNLFDHYLVFENYPVQELVAESVNDDSDISLLSVSTFDTSNYDLTLTIVPGEKLVFKFDYNERVYNKAQIEKLQQHFTRIVDQLLKKSDGSIHEIDYLSEAEKVQLLTGFNNTAVDWPKDKTVVELFREQAEKTPDAIALVFEDREITYRTLHEKSNRLANYLRINYEIQSNDLIGILLDRSDNMIVSMLGILKSGGAYVPIDPEYPVSRIKYILEDTEIKVLLTQTDYLFDIGYYKGSVFVVDARLDAIDTSTEPPVVLCKPDALSYVIYTSGSTGQPKGCSISGRNLFNYVSWANNYYFEKNKKPVFGFYTSLSFDLTVTSIFCSLTLGGKLVIFPQQKELADILADSFNNKSGINCIKLTPSHVNILAHLDITASGMECAIVGGEEVTQKQVSILKKIGPALKIYNEYGPTETTVGCVVKKLEESESILIGQPVFNTSIYILDERFQVCPVGVCGEIYISGAGVANGYLNKPALTKERFIANPFKTGERMYKSGDLGRWMADGNIEFLGRKDDQLKIRGYRVEPGEIASTLLTHKAVKEAIVIPVKDIEGNKRLVAYYTVSEEIIDSELNNLNNHIKDHLNALLPAYMMPAHFVLLTELPVTANGKIDKKALPEPENTGKKAGIMYVAPRTEIERNLVSVYEEVFKKQPIGIKDDFFVLGGDSIKSIQVVSRLKQRGYTVSIKDVMQYAVIEDLTPRLKTVVRVADQGLVEGIIPLSPIQKRFFQHQSLNKHHYNQSVLLVCKERISEAGLRAVLDKIILHHDALRMIYYETPEGWVQKNRGSEQSYQLEVLEPADDTVFIAHCEHIQSGIDLAEGPLFKAVLFRSTQGDRLLLVAHHLVIDGVSWRILLDDVSELYNQYLLGEPLILPLKTDSFKYWQEKVIEYAQSKILHNEDSWWSALGSGIPSLPMDEPKGSNLIKDSAVCFFSLDKSTTSRLLTQCYTAYRTEVNDVLLTALSVAIKEVFGMSKVMIDLESHGREPIGMDVDVSRTIGWFTSIYPVVIDLEYGDDIIRQLVEVKERLHRVPNKGIGYGILRYLAGKDYKIDPEISFNYLGDFGQAMENRQQEGLFTFSGDYHGKNQSEDRERSTVLNVTGLVAEGVLRLSISYSNKQFKAKIIEDLLARYRHYLEILIERLSVEEKLHLSPVDLLFKDLTIEQVLKLNKDYNIENVYPLSPMQEGLYYHWVTTPGASAYLMQFSYLIKGKIDVKALEKSYQTLVSRHAVLRTHFTHDYGKTILQVVKKEAESGFEYKDISTNNNSVEAFRTADRAKGFDLHSGSQMRLLVLGLGDDEYEFIWSHHHILMDGWCGSILKKEFFQIYHSILQNTTPVLSRVYPYSNYIEWLGQIDKEYALKCWKAYLAGFNAITGLPKLSAKKSTERMIQKRSFSIEGAARQSISDLCKATGITENIFVQAIWSILLSKYNNTPDVVFGSVVSGRPAELEGIEEMIGLFINTIPVRIQLKEGLTVRELLKEGQKDYIEKTGYHYVQLAEIQAQTELGKNLFDHILAFENYPVQEMVAQSINQDAALSLLAVNSDDPSNFDLTFVILPGEKLVFKIDYNENVYDEWLIVRLQHHFIQLIDQVINNPDITISKLAYVSEAETRQLLQIFNDTAVNHQKEKTIVELFEKQVEQTPDAIAVEFEGLSVTYKELNEKANQLANHLIANYSIQSDDLIGIMLDRSDKMIIAMLGILKSGGAYVPIDPEYPASRKSYILNDTGLKVLLTQSDYIFDLTYYSGSIFAMDIQLEAINAAIETPGIALHADALAYVIYTSGSTGQPKGCSITNSNLINYIHWANAYYFGDIDKPVFGLFTSLSFDLTVTSIFCPLSLGGRLMIYPQQKELSTILTHSFSEASGINCIKLTPSHVNILAHLALPAGAMDCVILGGEEVTQNQVSILKKLDPLIKIYNEYGPTEATVGCVIKQLEESEPVVIGKPISNASIYILDEGLQLCGIGISGELYISGMGVARGYLNRPELTAEKFIANPFRKGERMYRTGDLGRWLADGNIEFLGRRDDQVKVRGYRIELGEISNCLMKHHAVREAVVLAREDNEGNKNLVAYYVPSTEYDHSIKIITENSRRGLPEGIQLYELSDELSMYAFNKTELQFVYEEVFNEQCYLNHGVVIPENGCVVDIGANMGMFSVFAGMQAKGVKVYSFEPLPPTFEVLKLNTSLYPGEYKVFNTGISDKNEVAMFTFFPHATVLSSRYAEGEDITNIVMNTLINQEKAKGNDITGEDVTGLLKDRLITRQYECELKTLSRIIEENNIEQIDYLKIDVEKSELDVLNGIDEKDWPRIKQIVIEVHDVNGRMDTVRSILTSHGFTVHVNQNAYLEGTGLYDVYAVSEEILVNPYKTVLKNNGEEKGKVTDSLKTDIREYATAHLPAYMIPDYFVQLAELPLTPNGKIDKKRLPDLKELGTEANRKYEAPRNEIEKKLVTIWQHLLEKEKIGIHDNFFDVGGNSIKIVGLSKIATNALGIEISVSLLFEHANIKSLADYLMEESAVYEEEVFDRNELMEDLDKFNFN